MRRGVRVLLGIGLVVVAEIVVLVAVARGIGLGWTVLALLLLAALGGFLLRREGARAWASLRDAQSHPDDMGRRVTDAALVLVGGILLMLPGFLTDVLAVLCLLPVTRPLARRGVQAVLDVATRRYRDQADLLDAKLRPETVVEPESTPTRPPQDPTVIRGEIVP